jgi:hypothetical protein
VEKAARVLEKHSGRLIEEVDEHWNWVLPVPKGILSAEIGFDEDEEDDCRVVRLPDPKHFVIFGDFNENTLEALEAVEI